MHIVDWQSTILHAVGAAKPSPRARRDWARLKTAEDDDPNTWEDENQPGGWAGDGLNLWDAITTNSESPRTSFVYNVRKGPLRGAIR